MVYGSLQFLTTRKDCWYLRLGVVATIYSKGCLSLPCAEDRWGELSDRSTDQINHELLHALCVFLDQLFLFRIDGVVIQ